MDQLVDLLSRRDAIEALCSEHVFVAEHDFLAALRRPTRTALAGGCPVYVGQQITAGLEPSVLDKVVALQGLVAPGKSSRENSEVAPLLLWVDTHRVGSERGSANIGWTEDGRRVGIAIVPPGARHKEARQVQMDGNVLQRALDRLGTYLLASDPPPAGKERYRRLREVCLSEPRSTLSEFNRRLTHFLLQECLQFDPPFVFVSVLVKEGILTKALNEMLNELPSFVAVFNEERESLIARGIDPQVGRLDPDYLPLRWSCEVDLGRLTLRHECVGRAHFASGTCRCGTSVRVSLGSGHLDVAEAAATGQLSPDVTLPILLNDLASGVVLGRSSALYGLVLNQVLRRVLDKEPLPGLVPRSSADASSVRGRSNLLQEYLLGAWS